MLRQRANGWAQLELLENPREDNALLQHGRVDQHKDGWRMKVHVFSIFLRELNCEEGLAAANVGKMCTVNVYSVCSWKKGLTRQFKIL